VSAVCVLAAGPAFAGVRINVEAIDRYSDGADVFITIYENGYPGEGIFFDFELYERDEIIIGGSGITDSYGEALIEFSGLPSDTYFEGEIWVEDYDYCLGASRTFAFWTDSSLESKNGGCDAGIGGWIGLLPVGFIAARKRKPSHGKAISQCQKLR
jgi:hypothetical protein